MFLYKIEIELQDQLTYLIVVAESDAKAFDYAEGHLVRHYTVNPTVQEMSIVEKKRIDKGSGYVIETNRK